MKFEDMIAWYPRCNCEEYDKDKMFIDMAVLKQLKPYVELALEVLQYGNFNEKENILILECRFINEDKENVKKLLGELKWKNYMK